MTIELKEYHRNVPNEDLVDDLKKVAEEASQENLTGKEYDKKGKYSSGTITRRFGGWNKALEVAGLKVKFHHNTLSWEFINDLKRVAKDIGKETLTGKEYDEISKYGSNTVAEHFGSWNKALKRSGLTIKYYQKISVETLFENLEQVCKKLDRLPYRREMKLPLSKFSERPYVSNFGSWQKALDKFKELADPAEKELNPEKTETAQDELQINSITETEQNAAIIPENKEG